MSRRTEEKLAEIAHKWFNYHKTVTDPIKKAEFATRCVEQLIWLCTYLAEDIQHLEKRAPGQTKLYLPSSLKLDSNLREGGDTRP